MQIAYAFLRRVWPYVGPILGLWGLGKSINYSLADVWTAGEITAPHLLNLRIPYLLLAAVCLFFAYFQFRHRHTPITVLSTDVIVYMESETGDRVKVHRTQRLRPNREDVTGYKGVFWVAPPGKIPKSSIRCHINHCSATSQGIITEGNENRWEIIHHFPPIPWWLGFKAVTRTDQAEELDAFTNPTESYSFAVPEAYRHRQITITIFFHPNRICTIDSCRAVHLTSNGMVDLHLTDIFENGHNGVRLTVGRAAPGDTYKIFWTYP